MRRLCVPLALASAVLLAAPPPLAADAGPAASPSDSTPKRTIRLTDHKLESVRLDSLQRITRSRLYLTWGAPWGRPGAKDAIRFTCGDTARAETLWLSVDPGRTSKTFLGFVATIYVRPAGDDTLGTFWHFERTGENASGINAQYGPDSSFLLPQPWPTNTTGTIFYDHTPASGRIRLVCAVPRHLAGPVDSGTVYSLGRLIFRARRSNLTGCDRPVCLEWGTAQLSFFLGDTYVATFGERFVAWNPGSKDPCAALRKKPVSPVESKRRGAKPLGP